MREIRHGAICSFGLWHRRALRNVSLIMLLCLSQLSSPSNFTISISISTPASPRVLPFLFFFVEKHVSSRLWAFYLFIYCKNEPLDDCSSWLNYLFSTFYFLMKYFIFVIGGNFCFISLVEKYMPFNF